MHFVVKSRHLAHRHMIPKQVNLAIVPSQISTVGAVAAILKIYIGLYNNNNNGRNGSCLTWLATSLEEKRRWLIINASPRGQCSKLI